MVKQLKKLPFLLDGGFIKNIYADFQIDISFLNEDIAKIVNRLVFFCTPFKYLIRHFFIRDGKHMCMRSWLKINRRW